MFDKGTNLYHIGYMGIMVILVAIGLSMAHTGLEEKQQYNVDLSNKKDILKAVGLGAAENVNEIFAESVQGILLDGDGKEVTETDVAPLDINILKESKKDRSERLFPLFIYTNEEGQKRYIIPMAGIGLWDAIWGYVALEPDLETIAGVAFDHAGETPGLGAEIKDKIAWGQQFVGKKIFNEKGEFVSVDVIKGIIRNELNEVNSVSGATVTSDGVEDMMKEDIQDYLPYFKNLKN